MTEQQDNRQFDLTITNYQIATKERLKCTNHISSLYSQQHHCLSGQMTDNVPSTDVTQISLTLKMTITQVVKLLVTDNNSPIQDYTHLDNHIPPTYKV